VYCCLSGNSHRVGARLYKPALVTEWINEEQNPSYQIQKIHLSRGFLPRSFCSSPNSMLLSPYTLTPPTRQGGHMPPLRVLPPGSRSPKRSACERGRQATCRGGRRAWPQLALSRGDTQTPSCLYPHPPPIPTTRSLPIYPQR